MGLVMAGKPSDRKPSARLVDGVYNVNIRGIKVTVEQAAFDDFELLADLADLQEGSGSKTVAIFRRLLGDQGKGVLEELRGENGRVKASDAVLFIQDLFGVINPNS